MARITKNEVEKFDKLTADTESSFTKKAGITSTLPSYQKIEIKDLKNTFNDEQKTELKSAAMQDDLTHDTKNELEAINKQKTEIELKLQQMNEKNLQRLLYMSPSPETLPETEKLAPHEMELVLPSADHHVPMTPMMIGAVNPNLRVMTGPLRPRMNRPRSPYPPYMMRGRLSPFIGPRTSPPMTPSQIRMSPPLRPMPMHLYRNPSPTAGLIRITPRHLPPQYRMHQPNLNNPNFFLKLISILSAYH